MVAISITDKDTTAYTIPEPVHEGFSRLAVALWVALAVVMVALYVYFN
jgi:SSS family solute:Na+ symporter